MLVDHLSGTVATKWRAVGRRLLPPNAVKNLIDGEADGCQERLFSALEVWLNTGRARKERLLEAVKSSSAGGPNEDVVTALNGEHIILPCCIRK